MGGFLLGLFTILLMVLCVFTTLVVLMQRASSNAGMGSALGGGAAESAFGGDSGNVLSRATVMCMTVFFVITFLLYLGYMVRVDREASDVPTLPAVGGEAPTDRPLGGLSDFALPDEEDADAQGIEVTVGEPESRADEASDSEDDR